MTNPEHLILPKVYYIHKIDHRNGSSEKSQWTISEPIERQCFHRAYTSWRCTKHTCWGLHFESSKVAYLGVSKSSAAIARNLFIAKFGDSNENSKWHGYPADHVLNQQDIPPEDVLAMWLQTQHLRPAAIRKLSRGQKCKL